MACKSDIVLYELSLNIVKQCGPALSDILHNKFGCMVTIEGLDFESNMSFGQQKRQTVVPEQRFSVMLPTGAEVSVWKADLTNFPADAVVNAANCSLQHGAGLASALCAAGGSQIQQESSEYIIKNGNLKTGEAVVTNAGSLQCKKIIHAVGPHLPPQPTVLEVSRAEPLLETAIRSILQRATECHLDTVAIPAISSGLFSYPLQECANTIVSTVKHYYGKHSYQRQLPTKIFFVNHDEPTVTEMVRACRHILGPNQSNQRLLYSQAAGSTTSASKTSNVTIQIGSVSLTLKSDKIEDQKTDVIVNTASVDRNLQLGAISNALLKKAGGGMQSEIDRAPWGRLVIITGAYNLKSKEVFHTFCSFNRDAAAQKSLFDSVLECLWMAVSHHHSSISFPAIGTGHLGFDKREAAFIMSEAVANFAQNCPKKMDVYFVIFPSEYDTFQAFKEIIQSLQEKISHSGFTPAAYDNKEDTSVTRASAPQISLSGPSKESLHEAKKWLHPLLLQPSNHVVIHNNFIQHLSEKEYQQLSCLTKKGVRFEEFLANGHACLRVDGRSAEDVVVAAVHVEAMLCKVQKEFVTEEEKEMCKLLANDVPLERKRMTKTVEHSKSEQLAFEKRGLSILKVDKVENPSLEQLFELKKKQLRCSYSQRMFQRIPAQFCEMVSKIGFHAECAPPEDPKYGEGIYFARTVEKAMDVWREKRDEYVYLVEAEVLTGNSTHGKPGLILPPAVGTDPQVRFDSVTGGSDITVIFSSYQAMPRYIITCKRNI